MAAIVEASARILEQRGHEGFSTNAVAELAGVSVGSLYQYFPRKDALVGALILREATRLIADMRVAAAASGGPSALKALIQACVAHQLRRPALARLLDFEEARLPFDSDRQRIAAQINGLTLGLLTRADIPVQAEPSVAARDVLAIVRGMIDTAGECGETDQAQLAERVTRAVFGYLDVAP